MFEVDALVGDTDDYTSLAGLMLERFGTLPKVGDAVEIEGFRFEVAQVLERRIATVIASRIEDGFDRAPENS
nr:transporter associated domain-containing protein [Massilia sp. REN29]